MRISDWSSDVCSSDLRRQVVDEENAVEMIHLVLDAGRQQPLRRQLADFVLAVEEAHADLRRARHLAVVLGQGKAAFLVDGVFVGYFDQLRVGQEERRLLLVLPGGVDHDDPLQDAHLGSRQPDAGRSEEHTSELQSLMRISYAVFCLKKKNINTIKHMQTI